MNSVHLVIFCAVDYDYLLDDCIKNAKKYVKDNISSITVVSNGIIDTEYLLIQDQKFWNLLDPNFKYSNLYKHNWIKQQILKLNLDLILEGNILLCDVEVRFNKPIQWTDGNKFNVFFNNKPMLDSGLFVKKVIDVEPTIGFVTEAILLSSDILADLRSFIENKFKCNQLEAYRNLVYDDPQSATPLLKVTMSEYELYNNYVVQFYSERILKLNKHSVDAYSSVIPEFRTLDQESNTRWISFYDQVKDPSWPECYKEEDFVTLPEHIQQECINVHGYQPKKLTTK